MNKLLASELGFLGINVDSNFDLAWLKTEIADKIREGDQTSIYKLINFARHSEDPEIRRYANIVADLYSDKIDNYNYPNKVEDKEVPVEKEYEKVESAEDIVNAISSVEAGEEVNVEVTSNLDLINGDVKKITVPEGAVVEVKIDEGVEIACESGAFDVQNGGTLTLTGSGTISTNTKKGQAAVNASGANAKVVIDGITIDAITKQGKANNSAYGVYLSNDASLEFKSGVIKTAYGSCIGTNNTTGGNTEINISGGELYCDGSYAIYIPAQGTVNITGGKIQGINARMGVFNISGNAEIVPTTIDAEGYDDIGKEFKTSGCVWLGDTIAVMAGTYTDKDGTDCEFNISGNATVKSDFRSAIGIYAVDTKAAQNVTVNVENADKVSTTDENFDNIKVYDHAYITEAATAVGNAYEPVADSNIAVKVAGNWIYPENV